MHGTCVGGMGPGKLLFNIPGKVIKTPQCQCQPIIGINEYIYTYISLLCAKHVLKEN